MIKLYTEMRPQAKEAHWAVRYAELGRILVLLVRIEF
jgi:hypothetical protein